MEFDATKKEGEKCVYKPVEEEEERTLDYMAENSETYNYIIWHSQIASRKKQRKMHKMHAKPKKQNKKRKNK